MLAKNPRAPRGVRFPALSLATIVGTPPGACSLLQGIEVHPQWSGRLAFVFDLGAPLTTMAGERACRA
jgi:hypothetical protein